MYTTENDCGMVSFQFQSRNPVGVDIGFALIPQGSSFLATLGFEKASRWDSRRMKSDNRISKS